MKQNVDDYSQFASEYLNRGLRAPALEMMTRLMQFRSELKDKDPTKYSCIKAIVNSAYGVFASPSFRLFMPEIAAKVTEAARKGLVFVINGAEKREAKIIYGDTDSILIQIDKDKVADLVKYLNDNLMDIGDYEIKFEKYFEKFCNLGTKKRYFGICGGDKLEIKGFEEVRTDSSKLTKIIQENIMRMVLKLDKEAILSYLKNIASEFDKYSYEDIAIPKGLSRELSNYKVDIDYVRGAKWFKEHYKIGIAAGEKAYFLYTRKPTSVITVPDMDMFKMVEGLEVDKNKMLQRVVVKPIEDLIAMVDLSWKEIEGQSRMF